MTRAEQAEALLEACRRATFWAGKLGRAHRLLLPGCIRHAEQRYAEAQRDEEAAFEAFFAAVEKEDDDGLSK